MCVSTLFCFRVLHAVSFYAVKYNTNVLKAHLHACFFPFSVSFVPFHVT